MNYGLEFNGMNNGLKLTEYKIVLKLITGLMVLQLIK